MGVRLPAPGTQLIDADGAVVIQRGWSREKILAAIDAIGWVKPPTEYHLETWYMWSKARVDEEHAEFDCYWSPDGDCRTSIDVAIPVIA